MEINEPRKHVTVPSCRSVTILLHRMIAFGIKEFDHARTISSKRAIRSDSGRLKRFCVQSLFQRWQHAGDRNNRHRTGQFNHGEPSFMFSRIFMGLPPPRWLQHTGYHFPGGVSVCAENVVLNGDRVDEACAPRFCGTISTDSWAERMDS